MDNKYTTSALLVSAGALMMISGALMAVCSSLACGGIMWAAASCMFLTAYNFRLSENKMNGSDHNGDEYDFDEYDGDEYEYLIEKNPAR